MLFSFSPSMKCAPARLPQIVTSLTAGSSFWGSSTLACSSSSMARLIFAGSRSMALNPSMISAQAYTALKEWGYFPSIFSASVSAEGSISPQRDISRSKAASSRLSRARYPSRASTDVSKKSASSTRMPSSGCDSPDSHLYTAPTVTPRASASFSCVSFRCLRNARMFSESVSFMRVTSVDLLRCHYRG